jgi:class 3 adenylate cyclase
VAEAFFLFTLGLELTSHQIVLFMLFGFPAPILMYLLDRWLIARHVRPIQEALNGLEGGQGQSPEVLSQAWVQALNLPTLTLLRVLTVHAPSVLLPLTILCWLANHLVGLGLTWWQFIVLWLFWPVTSVPHATVEYFLIDHLMRPILARIEPYAGREAVLSQPPATPGEILLMAAGMTSRPRRIIRTSTGMQLAWMLSFVSLMPMGVLGTSAYLKVLAMSANATGGYLQELAQLVGSSPDLMAAQKGYLIRYDSQGNVVSGAPPPELSFDTISRVVTGRGGTFEVGPFLVGYAHAADGGLVLRALPMATVFETRSLRGWIIFLVGINIAVNVAMIALMSMRMQRSIDDLLSRMRQVQEGDLSRPWSPTSTDEFLDLGHGFNQMLAGLREREAIKDTFGRFVSREVAEAVLNGLIPLDGDRREISILFQDIRDFTGMAERMDPQVLIGLLNQFFTEMVAAVEAEGGVLKQFLGDGVMAIFGAPVPAVDHAARAVRAAMGMVSRLETLNRRLAVKAMPHLRIGVGVHSGEVVAGQIGPDTRMEYTVVGDAVNLASRLEGLTKEMSTTILVSQDTAQRLGPGFQFGRKAVVPVRGKARPITVVEVLGRASAVAVSMPTQADAARRVVSD